jgi:hypothetical protein
MAETVDTLIVELKAETKKLTKGLDKVNKQLTKTKKTSGAATNALKGFGAIVATLGLGKLAGETVQTIRKFEDLEATLRAITGGAEGAAVSFQVIREFTKGTTFQIDEVAEAFIRLKQAGVVPTSEVLQDFGNLSAGMGKSITQLAQAAFNATTGEMEMLKQFGIKAKLEGNTIVATFDGVTKTIDRSGDSIIEYLRSLGRESFPTAIEERLNTLSGAISNLGDASSEFMVAIGEGGLKDSLTKLSKEFTRILTESQPLAEFIGNVLGVAFNILGKTIIIVLDNINLLIAGFVGLGTVVVGPMVLGAIGTVIKTINALRVSINATTLALMVLQGAVAGAAAIKKIAIGVAAATAAYIALEKTMDNSIEKSKDKVKLDNLLIEKVKVTKEFTSGLTEENKKLVKSFAGLGQVVPTTLDAIVSSSGGIDNASQSIEAMYEKFRKERVQQERENFNPKFRRKRSIMGHDIFEDIDFQAHDIFKGDFFKEVFGMSEQDVRDSLDVSAVTPVTEMFDQIKNVFAETDELAGLKKLLDTEGSLEALFRLKGGAVEFGMSVDQLREKLNEFVKVSETKLTPIEETLKSIFEAGAKGDLEIATTAIDNNSAALQTLYDKLMLVDDEFAKLGLTFLQFKAQYDEGVASMSESTEELGASFVDVLAPAIQSMSLQFTSSFVDALAEGQDALGAFKDFAGNIVKQIIATFIQMAVVNKILNSIFGVGGFDVEGYKPLPTIGKAGGGTIQGGTPTLVGERGPEIFVPNTGGAIMNNMNSKNAMGGGTPVNIYQTISFATGIVPTVRAEVTKMMPQIADVTKAAVQESAMRGGNFRRSLVGG